MINHPYITSQKLKYGIEYCPVHCSKPCDCIAIERLTMEERIIVQEFLVQRWLNKKESQRKRKQGREQKIESDISSVMARMAEQKKIA